MFAVDKHQRRSAIHYAVAGGHVDVVKLLLSDDAKVHTEDGQVPLRDVRIHDMSGQCRCGAPAPVLAMHPALAPMLAGHTTAETGWPSAALQYLHGPLLARCWDLKGQDR